jgi:hypothetical protein
MDYAFLRYEWHVSSGPTLIGAEVDPFTNGLIHDSA